MDTEPEAYEISRSNERNLRFKGNVIAEEETNWDHGYKTKIRLYKTTGNNYVCERINYTKWIGDRTEYKGSLCKTTEEVIKFFGCGYLAKDLYDTACICCAVEVD